MTTVHDGPAPPAAEATSTGRSAVTMSTPMRDVTARRSLPYLDVLLVSVLAVLAVLPFRSLFASRDVVLLAVGAVAVCLAVNIGVERLPAAVAVLVGVVVAAVYLTVVVFRVGIEEDRGIASVWNGLSGSWADLLTAPVPTSTLAELASLPVTIAWIAAEIGVLLALRTRSASAPIIPPLVAFTVALLFTGEQPVTSSLVVAGLVVVALLVVLVRANQPAPGELGAAATGHGFGQYGIGLVGVGLITVGAVAVATRLPIADEDARVDLHSRYDPPLVVTESLSPLASLRPLLNDPSEEPVFTVRFTGIPAGTTPIDRVRTVVLEDYNGTVWATDATFAAAEGELPQRDADEVATIPISQDYTLGAGYDSSFLPALDRPISVDGQDLGVDGRTGVLVLGSTERDGFEYHVESAWPDISEDDARRDRAGNDPRFSRLSLAPNADEWPAEIEEFADRLPTAATRYDELTAMQDEFTSNHFDYDAEARPGHSLAVLGEFLTASPGSAELTPARVGYAEQFAAAFAVLARAEGLPTRVVVGYLVDPVLAASGEPVEVLSRQIHAWPEVHLNGVGWVAFEPTSTVDREIEPPPPPPETTIATEPTVTATTQPGSTLPPPDVATTAGDEGNGLPLGLLAVLAVVVLAPLAIVVAKRLVRRSRQSAGDAAQRTIAAWREARDQLNAHGRHIERSASVTDAAERAGPTLAPALHTLAPIVDRALYGVDEPDDDLATSAWEAQDLLQHDLTNQASIGQRARAAVDPRPLVAAVRRRGER